MPFKLNRAVRTHVVENELQAVPKQAICGILTVSRRGRQALVDALAKYKRVTIDDASFDLRRLKDEAALSLRAGEFKTLTRLQIWLPTEVIVACNSPAPLNDLNLQGVEEIHTDWRKARRQGNAQLVRLISENADSLKVLSNCSWETMELLPPLNLDRLVVFHLPHSVKKQQKMLASHTIKRFVYLHSEKKTNLTPLFLPWLKAQEISISGPFEKFSSSKTTKNRDVTRFEVTATSYRKFKKMPFSAVLVHFANIFPNLQDFVLRFQCEDRFQYHDSDSFRLERNTYADFIRSLEETLRSTDVPCKVTLAANMHYKITHKFNDKVEMTLSGFDLSKQSDDLATKKAGEQEFQRIGQNLGTNITFSAKVQVVYDSHPHNPRAGFEDDFDYGGWYGGGSSSDDDNFWKNHVDYYRNVYDPYDHGDFDDGMDYTDYD